MLSAWWEHRCAVRWSPLRAWTVGTQRVRLSWLQRSFCHIFFEWNLVTIPTNISSGSCIRLPWAGTFSWHLASSDFEHTGKNYHMVCVWHLTRTVNKINDLYLFKANISIDFYIKVLHFMHTSGMSIVPLGTLPSPFNFQLSSAMGNLVLPVFAIYLSQFQSFRQRER